MEKISIKDWQIKFANGEFKSPDTKTQIKAGWYDWFCKNESLGKKTYRMGNIVRRIKSGGKVDLDNWYVWFKNNCPFNGPLYDDFRFADLKTGEVQFTIQINCCWNKERYVVYGRQNDFEKPLFKTNDSRVLANWLNLPWKE